MLLYVGEHQRFVFRLYMPPFDKKIKGSLKHSNAVTYVTFDTQEKRNLANITHLESFGYLNVVLKYRVPGADLGFFMHQPNAEGVSHARGVRGYAPPGKILKSRLSETRFPAFPKHFFLKIVKHEF